MADQQQTSNQFAFLEYDIPQLLGLDRNKATGADPDGALVPDAIINLIPDRRGSLIPFARVEGMAGLSLPPDLIGFDTRGLSSFYDPADDKLAIFDGYEVEKSVKTYATLDSITHLSGVGPYAHVGQFFARTQEDDDPYLFEPFGIDLDFETKSSESSEAQGCVLAQEPIGGQAANSDVLDMVYHEYGGGERWAIVTREGFIKAGPSFDEAGDSIYNAGIIMESIAVSPGGTMIAVGGGGTIVRSTDGVNWALMSPGSPRNLRGVTYSVQASLWVAVGEDIQVSADDGITWTVEQSTVGPMFCVTVGVSASGSLVVLTKEWDGYGNYVHWTSSNGYDWTAHTTIRGKNPEDVVYGGGVWVAVGEGGVVRNSTDGINWLEVATLGGGVWLDAVEYDGESFVTVGDAGQVFKSSDGTAWEPVVIEGLTANMYAIVVHDSGTLFVAGNDGQGGAFLATFGLGAGTYTVYWVVSVPTKAGLLAVDLRSREFVMAGEAGNSITVKLPSIDGARGIKDQNGSPSWMTEDFLREKVYVDVYVKSRIGETGDTETHEDDVLADYGAHFDFTLRPGGGPQGADKTEDIIDKLPIGRLLGDEGAALLVALGEGETVMHRERVWGVFSDVESNYLKSDPDVSIEASQVVSGTAIGYTDIGYANLARPGNYLPIAPGDSTQFVGMVSTPSGLLVFFDNEVHLISGDPNDGSLATELYPDVIGADPGTRPTRLGGVAFSIWKGNIYALAGGQAQKLSQPAYMPDDKFVEVIPEPASRSLIARTQSGQVFRYVLDFQFWANNTHTGEFLDYMLPHADSFGARYISSGAVSRLVKDEDPLTPEMVWLDIDLGDKSRVDAVYGLRVTIKNYNPDSNGRPRLYYSVNSGESIQTDFVYGSQYEEEFIFRLPRGRKARLFDLRLVITDATYSIAVEPHIKILYVPGTRKGSHRLSEGGSPSIPM